MSKNSLDDRINAKTKKIDQELIALKKLKKQKNAVRLRALNAERTKKKQLDTRKKILVGAYFLEKLNDESSDFAQLYMPDFINYLRKETYDNRRKANLSVFDIEDITTTG